MGKNDVLALITETLFPNGEVTVIDPGSESICDLRLETVGMERNEGRPRCPSELQMEIVEEQRETPEQQRERHLAVLVALFPPGTTTGF